MPIIRVAQDQGTKQCGAACVVSAAATLLFNGQQIQHILALPGNINLNVQIDNVINRHAAMIAIYGYTGVLNPAGGLGVGQHPNGYNSPSRLWHVADQFNIHPVMYYNPNNPDYAHLDQIYPAEVQTCQGIPINAINQQPPAQQAGNIDLCVISVNKGLHYVLRGMLPGEPVQYMDPDPQEGAQNINQLPNNYIDTGIFIRVHA